MSFPNLFTLQRPLYSFSQTEHRTHSDRLRGLLLHGPMRPARKTRPKCLFVFSEEDRDSANHLYLSLRNGIASFPGCKQLVGLSLERDQVEAVRISKSAASSISNAFFTSIEAHLQRTGSLPDFAFILHSNHHSSSAGDPYSSAKAVLTQNGIPSQFVSLELLNSAQQFQYAISNIALSFFVKLGGVPWGLAIQQRPPTLVLGLGSSETCDRMSNTRRRFLGYAVCMLSNGSYLDTSFFSPALTYDEFLANFRIGLEEALRKLIQEHQGVEKVTIHVSGMERLQTVQAARDVIQRFEDSERLAIPLELVRLIDDSDFMVFDLSHPGYVSEEGTVVMLDHNHALVVTEGRHEKSVWRGRKPVTLELRRDYCSSPSLPMKDTVRDAFHLSGVNWRGLNAVNQPISLHYARLLAEQVAKMTELVPNISTVLEGFHDLKETPWFI